MSSDIDKEFKEEMVRNEMTDKNENSGNENTILDEESKKQVLKDLFDKVGTKGKNVITYAEISERLGEIELDKDQMDEIYETLIGKGIEVTMESEPDDIELMEIEDEDVDDPDVEAVIAENPEAKEIDLEATISKNISIDDPVRMYLKEIGKVPAFDSTGRNRACEKNGSGRRVCKAEAL